MNDDFDKRSSNHEFDVHEIRKITLNSIQTRHSAIIEGLNKTIEDAARDGRINIRIWKYAWDGKKRRDWNPPEFHKEGIEIKIMEEIKDYYKSLGFIVSLEGPTRTASVQEKVWILGVDWAYDSLKPRQLDTNHPFIKSALK